MKKTFLTSILIFTVLLLTAQTSFKKIISEYDYQNGISIAEDNNGNFVIIGLRKIESERKFSYIIKINKLGDLIQDTVFYAPLGKYNFLENIIFFNNNYYITGSVGDSCIKTSPPYHTKIWILKLDTNLNIIKNDTLNFNTDYWISYQRFIIDSDSNIVIIGSQENYADTIVYSQMNSNPFFYKITLNCDSIKYKTIPTISYTRNCDIIEKTNNNGYLVFSENFENAGSFPNKILDLNKDFFINSAKSIPNEINRNFCVFRNNIDSSLYVAGNTSGYNNIGVINIDTNFNLIDVNYYNNKPNILTFLFYESSFCKAGDYYYLASNTNNYRLQVYKLDSDLSLIWDKYIEGDASYDGFSIIATNDGGCIIIGNRFGASSQSVGQSDIYVVKIAPDGSIQWKNNIKVNNDFKIYPNPGNNFINIQSDINYSQFIMFDISGKQVLNKQNNKQQINTTNLPNGVYIYKIIGKNNKTLKTGKWIKN